MWLPKVNNALCGAWDGEQTIALCDEKLNCVDTAQLIPQRKFKGDRMTTQQTMIKMTAVVLLAGAALAGCQKKTDDAAPAPAPAADAGNMSAQPAANTSIPGNAGTIGGHDGTTAAPPGSTGGTSEALGDHVSTGTGSGTTNTGAAGTPADPAKQDAASTPAPAK